MNRSSKLEFLGSFLARMLIVQAESRASKEVVAVDLKPRLGSRVELGGQQNRASFTINRNVD